MSEQATTGGKERALANLRPWKPGQSGNPTGRPQGIEALARVHTPAALERLVLALNDEDSRVAVTAASILLDRGWGKAPIAPPTPGETAVQYVIRGPAPVGSTAEWLKTYAPTLDAEPNNE